RRAVAGDDLLFPQMYKTLLRLSADAHPDVALAAREACDVLMQCYAHSQAFFDAEAQLDQALHRLEISRSAAGQAPILGFLRSTAGVGDALLGQPRSEAEAEAGTGTETETGTESPSQSSSQSRNQQRRQSAHSHFHAATPTAGLPPRRAVGQVQQQQQQHGRVVAAQAEVPHAQSHRYTMHFAPMVREALLREPIKSPERKKALPPAVADAWLAWGRRELRAQASTLVDWAGAHFTEFDISLFANVSGPLRGSAALAESRERARRVARMEASARAMGAGAGQMKWVDVAAVAAGAAGASAALLHPVEPHAVVATRLGSVAVYDWERGAQVAQWGIGPRGGRHAAAGDVCALHLLNPLGQAKLLVGTADGMVRVFASHAPDFAPPPAPIGAVFPRPRLLTAFMALPWASSDPPPPHRYGLAPATVVTSNQRMRALQGTTRQLSALEGAHHAGLQHPAPAMATAWNQRSGVLFAGGGGKEVRVWDVAAELCIEEIAVAPTGGVTCISHDGVSGNIFATGSAAGVVRVMDRRVDARAGMVANWREHAPSRICGVAMRPGHTEVVSAAASGEVKFWDLRHRDAMHTIEATHAEDVGGLRHMLAHEHAHVTLTASASTVKLWNQRGSNIGVVTGAKHTYGSAASYMKSLAGYGPPRRAAAAVAAAAAVPVEPGASVAAVAMHTYLPVALMVTDDGRVSYIRPSKGSSSSASASSARGSGGGGGSSYPHHPPSLASTRASSIL
ncbi:Target of rapamycin complex 1 subunit kog1, partial [Coemansia sp. RSA 1836]